MKEKVIKPIPSENIIIFASNDIDIVISLLNLPLDKEIIFITEFVQFNKSYEYKILGDYPEFKANSYNFNNVLSRGKILTNTINEIINIKKEMFLEQLGIVEEKYLNNENKNSYLITYKSQNEKYSFRYKYSLKYIFNLRKMKRII